MNNISFQIQHEAFDERFQQQPLIPKYFHHIQAFIGLSWILGCLVFGGIIIRPSTDCQVSKPRLSQLALFFLSLINLALPYTKGYQGISIYAWMYGFFYGGYNLSLKLYVYEIGKPRHFCFLWGVTQLMQGNIYH